MASLPFWIGINSCRAYPGLQRLRKGSGILKASLSLLGEYSAGGKREKYGLSLIDRCAKKKEGRSFPVIPVLLPGCDPVPSFLFLNTWIDLRSDGGSVKAESLKGFERSITANQSQTLLARAPTLSVCPYRGLETFREEHAAFFAGRAVLASSLLEFCFG